MWLITKRQLAIPMAVNESGWIGILLLVFCGVLSNITANLLGETMFHMEELREYVISSSLTSHLFQLCRHWREGVWWCGQGGNHCHPVCHSLWYHYHLPRSVWYNITTSIYTDIGQGSIMNSMPVLSCVPAKFYTFLGGLFVLCLVIALPTMKEVAWAACVTSSIKFLCFLVLLLYFLQSQQL